jgi:hypothetical protein
MSEVIERLIVAEIAALSIDDSIPNLQVMPRLYMDHHGLRVVFALNSRTATLMSAADARKFANALDDIADNNGKVQFRGLMAQPPPVP